MIGGTRYRLTAEIARQSKLASEIARAQSDISSETRLQRASDDPAASARVAAIRRTQANEKTWATNVEAAATLSNAADTALETMQNALDRAAELMTRARSGTNNAADRAAIATELRGIVEDFAALSNRTDSRGQPLFADGGALAVPVGHGLYIAPAASKAAVFGGIATDSGPQSIEQILARAADAVELGDDTARAAATAASLTAIGASQTHVTAARADQGVRGARLDSARERLAGNALDLGEERTNLAGTDLPSTVASLQAKLLTLDAAQKALARISQLSLFDKLG